MFQNRNTTYINIYNASSISQDDVDDIQFFCTNTIQKNSFKSSENISENKRNFVYIHSKL
jgi:hypothetical protein